MKMLFFTTIFLMVNVTVRAQFAIDALAGHKNIHYINYFDNVLDSSRKFKFFNLNRITVNYKDKALNTVSIEGQFTYQFKPWIGISVGGGYYGEFLVPGIGLSLSYMNKKEDFFIQMYPTIGYVEKQVAPSILGLIGYTPKFSKRWGLSSQIIFSVDPIEAAQIVRIGGDYKDKIQFGIGIDNLQNFQTKISKFNLGPFIRYIF